MTVQLELWQLITLLVMFLGASAAAGKVLLDQMSRHLDERFASQTIQRTEQHDQVKGRLDGIESAAREEAGQWQRVERELLELKAELPMRFVMRDDYVRGQSVIEAKLDGLAVRIENVQLRTAKGE